MAYNNRLMQYLKRSRVDAGYTQRMIAQELHYSTSAIGAFESGRNDSFTFCQYYLNKFCTDEDILRIIRGDYNDCQ